MIHWNDGLSVGIKSLDDDHKKILNIINKISTNIEKNQDMSSYDDIFEDLQEYIVKHFQQEEAYLKKCKYKNFEEHKKQHQEFADKIPHLKKKFLESKNYKDAKDISNFLTDWLLNHIISEDMSYIDALENCAINQGKKRKLLLSNIIKKTAGSFNFTNRIKISAAIPLLGMFVFAVFLLWNDFEEYTKNRQLLQISGTLFNINDLSHALEIERGLGGGYLSSRENKFKNELQKQRIIVNATEKEFIEKLQSLKTDKPSFVTQTINNLQKNFLLLKSIRKKVDVRIISKKQEITSYNKIVENTLGIIYKIMSIKQDSNTANSMSLIAHLMHMQNILGLQRAYGTIVIEQKSYMSDEYREFVKLLGKQDAYFHIFMQMAPTKYKNSMDAIEHESVMIEVLKYKKDILNNHLKILESKIWFALMTKHINDIKYFSDESIKEINSTLNNNLHKAKKRIIIEFAYILFLLLLTRFIIYIFEKSMSSQVTELADAMKRLAQGDKSLRLRIEDKGDEISEIYKAYETTRQELLKADIVMQLYQGEQNAKLTQQKIQNKELEKIAFLDPLTGTVNRRKFNKLSKIELERSRRYKQSLSFLMLDIDHFKNVNDTHGHAIGDEVLKHFSNICINMARKVDTIARIGGEEFVIMLPETDKEGAYTFAQRLRESIFNASVNSHSAEIKYSVSIGVAVFEEGKDKNVSSILQRADKALYAAKEKGRNRVEIM